MKLYFSGVKPSFRFLVGNISTKLFVRAINIPQKKIEFKIHVCDIGNNKREVFVHPNKVITEK